ncbi:MAG: hypothetical protein KF768_07975 [Phycisphaeraceae bacterium]|nr:hypothetical protein [Phycisphaeraceae bacterium]
MQWLLQTNDQTSAVLLLVFVTAVAIVMVLVAARERNRANALDARLSQMHAALQEQSARSASGEDLDRQRQSVMFEQHKRLNELTIDKLEAEITLIKNQSGERDREQERFEAGKEYHELMVEKTRLEIDSLRLHITELRQRLDDWKFGS